MPLKLNVGLAKKFGESNYGSRGACVEIEMELESSLASEPAKLRERIRQLFDSVRTSLTEELNGTNSSPTNSANGHAQGNGRQNGNGHQQYGGPPVRPATSSQIKAIYAIARKQRVDVTLVLQNRFHVTRLEDLSIGQASELTDSLKSTSGA